MLKHECIECGGSCRGVRVRPTSKTEERHINELASKLEISNPWLDGALRTERGSCVFLDEVGLCKIHAGFGIEAKPAICRQYPLVCVHTETGRRLGIDPGCYGAIRSWRAGPVLVAQAIVAAPSKTPFLSAEGPLLQLLGHPELTLQMLIQALTRQTVEAFALSVLQKFATFPLGELLARPEGGPTLKRSLSSVAEILQRRVPPAFAGLAPEVEAYALHCVYSMVYLRLVPPLPPPQVVLLMLSGIVVAGLAEKAPNPFGAALAGWSRAIRAPAFLTALR